MPLLSIIIPAWNEAPLIADAVRSAASIADEVIVVDGFSTDKTGQRAGAAGAKVLVSGKGRGIQMHTGALTATGDILLFLHADVRLPENTRSALLEWMNDPSIIGSNFLIEFLPARYRPGRHRNRCVRLPFTGRVEATASDDASVRAATKRMKHAIADPRKNSVSNERS